MLFGARNVTGCPTERDRDELLARGGWRLIAEVHLYVADRHGSLQSHSSMGTLTSTTYSGSLART